MGHQNIVLAAAALLLASTGCDTSIEVPANDQAPVISGIEPEVLSKESEAEADQQEIPLSELPEAVPASEPVHAVKGDGFGDKVVGAHRNTTAWAGADRFRQALAQYQALNGELPKSHEEFMKKAWEPQKMPMPPIEEGYVYRYLPEMRDVWKVRKDLVPDADN